ncbi:carboxypeptidase cpdS precursor [Trichoderma gamsii]|uniref:Carboxypeptidase cpdS n=1 Tax=Trichoderma gamsii TaxID=398673 RepID=A0A2P4Z9F0_9HYPO|nr:carboxypeptidase cpdS precursor [Trichoderma gamsii]PON20892.1 carboxypeptidase cpdS precursor [Trichoderma gamsii]
MKFWGIWSLLAAVGIVVAAPPTNDFLGIHTLGLDNRTAGAAIHPPPENHGGCGFQPQPEPRFYNSVTKGFYVNGTTLPEIDFDVGDSYAGNLPISNKRNESDELFFWFFPTVNQEYQDDKEIVIWLSGGPGCSSMMALFLENGPISWQPGTLEPISNPFSWHLLTNVVWIDQPVGTGFSKGNPSITDEDGLAEQFKGFWRNFVDTFGLHGWKVYIAGESWAGMYGPYISSHFIDAKDTDYFDVQGLIIYDGNLFGQTVHSTIPILPFVTRYQDILPFNDTMLSSFRHVHEDCGFTDYFEKYLVFPPVGIQPDLTPVQNNDTCYKFWDNLVDAASAESPCFSPYNIIDRCPYPYDAIVNPANPTNGSNSYFNRAEVKRAIHAPDGFDWTPCFLGVFPSGIDNSSFSGFKQLPHVIDTTRNVILAQGGVDAMFPINGAVLGIQNMTWGGELGFQYQPQDPFYVPNYGLNSTGTGFTGYGSNSPASFGVLGTTHHERGLTLVATKLAGHQGPGYAPAASFRHLEKLLGRVKSLSGTEPFTLPKLRNISQPAATTLGKGTMPIP